MKTTLIILLLTAAACCVRAGQLTEESIRDLLKSRSEAFEQADVETIVGLYTTNAVITMTYVGMPDSTEFDPQKFAESFSASVKLVAFSTDPSKINMIDGGAVVAAETHLSHSLAKNQKRAATWRIEETFKITLIDGLPKIAEERMAIVTQTLEPDEFSERVMKLVRQEGGIDKETAIKLLEESGCKYEEGDGKRTSISTGYKRQCGDEIAALATCIPGVQTLQLLDSMISDDGLADIGKIQTLETLYLMGKGISDEGIARLSNLARLKCLSLSSTDITDQSFVFFADFPALKNLYITRATGVTDAGLLHLSKVETLENLRLTINMTDVGLKHLVEIPNLLYLRIEEAPITDAGLVYVEQMEKLRAIRLNKTEVTYKGAKRLQEKRPKLKISPSSLMAPCALSRNRLEYRKKLWAQKENKKVGATPTREDLEPYLKYNGGFARLACEDGGTFTINPIGTGAECSIHGKTEALIPTEPPQGLSKEDFDIDGVKAGRWTMDLDAAKKLATEKQLSILLNFTGSDWCGWCKLMEKNIFSKPEWSAYATNHIIMVLIDFPRDKTAVPEKYKERNNTLKEQYGIRGYPTFVLLKPDGQTELARLQAGREKTPASFIDEIKMQLSTKEGPPKQ